MCSCASISIVHILCAVFLSEFRERDEIEAGNAITDSTLGAAARDMVQQLVEYRRDKLNAVRMRGGQTSFPAKANCGGLVLDEEGDALDDLVTIDPVNRGGKFLVSCLH